MPTRLPRLVRIWCAGTSPWTPRSFFASLKGECLDLQPWPTRAGARRATVEDIAWYNGTRLHSALGYQTPDEYESITRKEVTAQAA